MPIIEENVNKRTEQQVVTEEGTKVLVTMEQGNPALKEEAHWRLEVKLTYKGQRCAGGDCQSNNIIGALEGGRSILREIAQQTLKRMLDLDFWPSFAIIMLLGIIAAPFSSHIRVNRS